MRQGEGRRGEGREVYPINYSGPSLEMRAAQGCHHDDGSLLFDFCIVGKTANAASWKCSLRLANS